MVQAITTAELPEWINLSALTTPDEISQRATLATRGDELIPALAAWINDAMPLAERPPLLEVVDDTRELMYSHMGITPLVVAIEQLRELLAHCDAGSTEPENRVSQLHAGDTFDAGTDELGQRRDGEPIAATGDGERPSRWRNQQ